MRTFLCALLLAPICCAADFNLKTVDPAQAGMDAERLARIPVRMKAFVNEGKAAGIVTMVVRHGHLASLDAAGYQDVETKTPMRTDSIFRIMSMTKPVTSVALMTLIEDGLVALTDPVEKYLPEFHGQQVKVACPAGSAETSCVGKPSRAMTLFDLLTHTSGVAGSNDNPKTLAERVATLAHLPIDFEPGSQWRYRTEGIDTLGRIIEVVSHTPYEKFIAERIFVPLGMTDSAFFPQPGKSSRIAAVYTDVNGVLKAAESHDTLYPSPGAGMLSTAADMARFYQMMLNKGTLNGHRILSPASVETMTMVQTGDRTVGFAPGMGFGLGWGVVKDANGTFRLCSIGSFGHGGAYRTYGWVDPAMDMIRIIMLQRTNGGGDIADETNAFLAMAGAAMAN
jgi:CubicO group peptidase (beta-lactamase class C family)